MKKFLLILTLFICSILNAGGSTHKKYDTPAQVDQSAYEDFKKAEKKLNIAYNALRKKSRTDQIYFKNLKISQEFWVKFRDAQLNMLFSCTHEDKHLCFGNLYEILYYETKAELTIKRAKNLEKLGSLYMAP